MDEITRDEVNAAIKKHWQFGIDADCDCHEGRCGIP